MTKNPFDAPAAGSNPFDQAEPGPGQGDLLVSADAPEVEAVPVEEASAAEKLAGAPESPNEPSAARPASPRQQVSAKEKAQKVLERLEETAKKAEQRAAALRTALNEAELRATGARQRAEHQKNHPDLQG